VSVETRDGTEFLIPNEDIITQQVLNWSHRSDRVRLKVPVRVPHDSDVNRVLALMLKVARNRLRQGAVPRPMKFMTRTMTKITRKTKNRILAIPAAVPAMPLKPRTAATMAIKRATSAQ
jgi:small-conductance mechanosensitive channel